MGDDWNDDYFVYIVACASFCPILNIVFTFVLVLWYVLEASNKTNCGD